MVLSMTGYGRAGALLHGRDIKVELRSVNARFFEYSSRLPRSCAFLEDKLKKLVASKVSRGKVELSLSIQTVTAADTVVTVNWQLAEGYRAALNAMAERMDLKNDVSVGMLSRFPDVLTQTAAPTNEDELWEDVRTVAEQAVDAFVAMRAVEGEKMKADVAGRLTTIETLVAKIEENSAGRVQAYSDKLYARLQELLGDRSIDEGRLVTEAAIFADKTAIDEETVRLHSHVAQYREILELDEPIGRKLDFLTQELNRESNTIGSKCQDVAITRLVVELKSEIEKIREQIQNIEYRRFAMKLLNIGFGNMVNADRIIGIVSPDSAPIKRLVQDAREKGALIDASYGRRTQAVLIMDSDHVILSGIPLESLTGRANEETEEQRK